MKILLVSHGFPPEASAGTETYTAELGLALQARGHVVRVFTTTKDISRPNASVTRRDWRGLAVDELVNNLYYEEFRETWEEPRVEAAFDAVLREFAPHVAHFQHLLYLSGGIVRAARDAGAAVLFTLHDFWLQCPRFGQRVHPDGGVCHTIDFERCGTCLARFKFGQGPLERRVGEVIAGVRAGTGINLGPLARGAAAKLGRGGAEPDRAEPDLDRAARYRDLARERSDALRARVVPAVQRFLSPSRFLRERFVAEWGIPPDRIEHLRFGVDLDAFQPRPRTASDVLRVGFLGSLVPIKGAHLLLDAWALLAPDARARGRLVLRGPARHHPDYQDALARRAAAVGARLGGPLDRAGVAEFLADTDLLVVPSLWYENSPLVILEALASRTPLLVSDLGGMAELVEPGVSGFHFRMGDVRDLADRLAAALAGRAGLDRLYATPVLLPRFDAHVALIEARYVAAVDEARRA